MRRLLRQTHSAALISLLVGMSVFPDLVLCVGDNGHRSFEIVSEACCHTGGAGDSGCRALDDHCSATCSDVRLGAATVLAESSGGGIAADDIASVCTVALPPAASRHGSLIGASVSQTGSHTHFLPVPRDRHSTVQLC